MDAALRQSERWYGNGLKTDAPRPDLYNGLNWLFLAALHPVPKEKATRIDFAQRCVATANDAFGKEASYWNAIGVPDALLAEALIDGSLVGADGRERVERLAQRYDDARTGIQVKAKDFDSTVQQICLMALFYCARAKPSTKSSIAARTAAALRLLAEHLSPGACAGVFGESAANKPASQ